MRVVSVLVVPDARCAGVVRAPVVLAARYAQALSARNVTPATARRAVWSYAGVVRTCLADELQRRRPVAEHAHAADALCAPRSLLFWSVISWRVSFRSRPRAADGHLVGWPGRCYQHPSLMVCGSPERRLCRCWLCCGGTSAGGAECSLCRMWSKCLLCGLPVVLSLIACGVWLRAMPVVQRVVLCSV